MIVAGLELTRTMRYPSAPEGLAGLGAGVVELAPLADDDRAGAEDEDGLDVGALWHGAWVTHTPGVGVCEVEPRGRPFPLGANWNRIDHSPVGDQSFGRQGGEFWGSLPRTLRLERRQHALMRARWE
jgi:hypothetical protein